MKKIDSPPLKSKSELKTDGYEVGFKKPPVTGRFQPGKSGNPKGRPKHSPDPEEIVAKLMKTMVTITEGGNPKKILSIDALLRKQFHQAFKGDKYSTKLMLGYYHPDMNKTEVSVKTEKPVDVSHLSPAVLEALENLLLLVEGEAP